MIVAVVNMKGGVGKTTLAVNLALGLAKYHDKKVLLVDADPQSNATQYLMPPDKYRSYLEDSTKCTIRDVFLDRPSDSVGTGSTPTQKSASITPTKSNCTIRVYGTDVTSSFLDLLPSRLELMEAETLSRGVENRLKKFLHTIKPAYDIIFLDCPPTIGLFTLSAFLAADSYLVPLKPDYLSSVGLPLIDKAIRNFQGDFPIDLKYLGVIFTMIQKTTLMRDTMITLRNDTKYKCFENSLSHGTKIAAAVRKNQTILDLVNTKHADEMVRIVDEFARRVMK